MKAVVADFFELPLVEKKVYAMAPNDFQGYGQGYVVSDEQKLDWNDLIFLITSPPKYKNMKHWPTALTGFRYAYQDIYKTVAFAVLTPRLNDHTFFCFPTGRQLNCTRQNYRKWVMKFLRICQCYWGWEGRV